MQSVSKAALIHHRRRASKLVRVRRRCRNSHCNTLDRRCRWCCRSECCSACEERCGRSLGCTSRPELHRCRSSRCSTPVPRCRYSGRTSRWPKRWARRTAAAYRSPQGPCKCRSSRYSTFGPRCTLPHRTQLPRRAAPLRSRLLPRLPDRPSRRDHLLHSYRPFPPVRLLHRRPCSSRTAHRFLHRSRSPRAARVPARLRQRSPSARRHPGSSPPSATTSLGVRERSRKPLAQTASGPSWFDPSPPAITSKLPHRAQPPRRLAQWTDSSSEQ